MPDSRLLTVLGFDFGSHWIGTAVGQTQSSTASPLQPVRVINRKPDWPSISKLVETWQPDLLLVGLPTKMNDENDEMTEPAMRFSRQLQGRYQIRTELVDERMTTREAWQILEQHAQKQHNKPDIDSIAAVLITETWLHAHSRTG
jgi:putative Holliday junction resolvase